SINGFSTGADDTGGRHAGVTSADEGEGYIFTGDHGTATLYAIDEKNGKVSGQAHLAGDPDTIRYVGTDHEIWVTEPAGKRKQIEIFNFAPGKAIKLSHAAAIPVPEGP